MKHLLERYIGEPIAVFCARYIYRGILREIAEDAILLTNASSIEVTGPSSHPSSELEDPIPSDLIISLGAIEIVCQPTWVFHNMEKSANREKSVKGQAR